MVTSYFSFQIKSFHFSRLKHKTVKRVKRCSTNSCKYIPSTNVIYKQAIHSIIMKYLPLLHVAPLNTICYQPKPPYMSHTMRTIPATERQYKLKESEPQKRMFRYCQLIQMLIQDRDAPRLICKHI